ncbi:uracil-DNA glycosylase [Paenibacillus solisilvae]|uniref:Uracil-DNA glycosylase n=1 Tax=Paenibacillus solisilvae TaxID=2486751 RepID=A0ABW0W0I2_9BACL
MHTALTNDWASLLEEEFEQAYFKELRGFLDEQYRSASVYPKLGDIFNALNYTSYEGTKVVIIGQDPYHGPGQAHGLSFSVQPGVKVPPSLQNIFKELREDLGCDIPDHGSLISWAQQGVLLLNNVLTVQAGQPASHQGRGWERFTDAIINALNKRQKPVVFILWGKHAQEKAAAIDETCHCVISSPHPSPFAARKGFFGSRPFTQANDFLRQIGSKEIDWHIPTLAELESAAAWEQS